MKELVRSSADSINVDFGVINAIDPETWIFRTL
ncbi:hypothetical protein A2U01_0101989 [Trifolium medium]|uniref:Uncharacterized protein n=1 Tax=Trifolium medium TaxID=97028 RepID=A0A392UXJ9_9FABA|nr:hypothetical protein [Trifolium medium]